MKQVWCAISPCGHWSLKTEDLTSHVRPDSFHEAVSGGVFLPVFVSDVYTLLFCCSCVNTSSMECYVALVASGC